MVAVVDDAIIAAMIAATATAGSSYYTNQMNADNSAAQIAAMGANQAANMEFNANQAALQREFTNNTRAWQNTFAADQANLAYERSQNNFNTARQMADTTYQRTMSDMRAAGLNPILAYSKGAANNTPQPATISGASAPGAGGGATASVGTQPAPSLPQVEGLLSGGAISAATQVARGVADVDNVRANTTRAASETALNLARERESNANTALRAAEAVTEGVRPENVRAGTRLFGAQTGATTAQGVLAQAQTGRVGSEIDLNRARAQEAFSSAGLRDTENTQRQQYGPPGSVSSLLGGAITSGGNIGAAIRGFFQ